MFGHSNHGVELVVDRVGCEQGYQLGAHMYIWEPASLADLVGLIRITYE